MKEVPISVEDPRGGAYRATPSESGTGLTMLGRLIKQILADGTKAWDLPAKMVTILGLFPIVVALMGAGSALLGKEAYVWFTGEDRFAESSQVLFYVLTFVLSLVVARRQQRAGEKIIALLYLGLCLAMFFMIGEELSWGQRIFGWGTANELAAINKQDETNLHNIYGVGSTFKWVQMLVGAYGAILPLVVLWWSPPVRLQKLASAVVPHYTLILYFLPLFLWRLYRNLLEPPKAFYFVVAEYNEVMELILSIGLFLFVVFQLRRIKRET